MTSILKTFHHFNRSSADNKHRTRSYDLWRVTGNWSHASVTSACCHEIFVAVVSNFIDCKTVRIFAYSSTREQSNEAENRERDWGETLKIRFFFSRSRASRAQDSYATLYRFLYWFWEKKPTVLQSSNFNTVFTFFDKNCPHRSRNSHAYLFFFYLPTRLGNSFFAFEVLNRRGTSDSKCREWPVEAKIKTEYLSKATAKKKFFLFKILSNQEKNILRSSPWLGIWPGYPLPLPSSPMPGQNTKFPRPNVP